MGVRGPVPLPSKVVNITKTLHRPKQSEPEGELKQRVHPPSTLPKEAVKIWKRLIPELKKINLLSNLDMDALVRYCITEMLYHRAIKQCMKEGFTVENRYGETVIHPAARQANELGRMLTVMAQQFGLTPVGRLRMRAPIPSKPSKEEALETFLFGEKEKTK